MNYFSIITIEWGRSSLSLLQTQGYNSNCDDTSISQYNFPTHLCQAWISLMRILDWGSSNITYFYCNAGSRSRTRTKKRQKLWFILLLLIFSWLPNLCKLVEMKNCLIFIYECEAGLFFNFFKNPVY